MATILRDEQLDSILQTVYPVGVIYVSTLSTNPATLLGFGTWTAFGAGKCLVGINAAETEFDTVEETGGAKTVALATTDIAAHLHNVDPPNTTSAGQSVTHNHAGMYIYASASNSGTSSGGRWSGATSLNTGPQSATHTHTLDIAEFNSVTAGSGTAHSNLMPYITTYFWKRTA